MREHFPGLEDEKDAILDAVLGFFEDNLQRSFPEADYTFDVYLTSANKVQHPERYLQTQYVDLHVNDRASITSAHSKTLDMAHSLVKQGGEVGSAIWEQSPSASRIITRCASIVHICILAMGW